MGGGPRARPIVGLVLAGAALIGMMGVALAKADPMRVVSMNLCTDQLAMMIAEPGQLISVSPLARDTRSSAMAAEAEAFAINHGLAEEIYLLKPDLVVTGLYSRRAAADMLERLGTPVVRFDIARDMEDIRAHILQMGAALGQEARAEALAAEFDAGLAALRTAQGERPRAALYFTNGFTAGESSLSGQILSAAGFANIASDAGYPDGGVLPLEILALTRPEAVITGQSYGGTSRAEAVMEHPVIHALRQGHPPAPHTDHDWMCGTPYVLRAVTKLTALRVQTEAQAQ